MHVKVVYSILYLLIMQLHTLIITKECYHLSIQQDGVVVKDHWSHITIINIIMRKLETLWELPKFDTETRDEQTLLEKWGPWHATNF